MDSSWVELRQLFTWQPAGCKDSLYYRCWSDARIRNEIRLYIEGIPEGTPPLTWQASGGNGVWYFDVLTMARQDVKSIWGR